MSFTFIPQVQAAITWTSDCQQDGVATIRGIVCVISNILSPLPALIALSAVGMIIFAGIKIINAGGNATAYAAGWSTFIYALVGLVLLSVVWFALTLIENYTGAPVTKFGID